MPGRCDVSNSLIERSDNSAALERGSANCIRMKPLRPDASGWCRALDQQVSIVADLDAGFIVQPHDGAGGLD